jgi:hypothetical protein
VTRGTRPKKPSSSRGFAREARRARGVWGVWGFWGLKTENRKLKIEKKISLFKPATTTKIIIYFIYFLFIYFRVRTNAWSRPRGHAHVRTNAPCITPGNFKKDALVRLSHGRPRGHRPIVRPSVCPKTSA